MTWMKVETFFNSQITFVVALLSLISAGGNFHSISRNLGLGWWWSIADTEVPGSIPGVDIDFSDSVSQTSLRQFLTLVVGLFYLSVFPVQLIKLTPILLSFFYSSLPLCESCTKVNKCSFSISVLYLPDCWNQSPGILDPYL